MVKFFQWVQASTIQPYRKIFLAHSLRRFIQSVSHFINLQILEDLIPFCRSQFLYLNFVKWVESSISYRFCKLSRILADSRWTLRLKLYLLFFYHLIFQHLKISEIILFVNLRGKILLREKQHWIAVIKFYEFFTVFSSSVKAHRKSLVPFSLLLFLQVASDTGEQSLCLATGRLFKAGAARCIFWHLIKWLFTSSSEMVTSPFKWRIITIQLVTILNSIFFSRYWLSAITLFLTYPFIQFIFNTKSTICIRAKKTLSLFHHHRNRRLVWYTPTLL